MSLQGLMEYLIYKPRIPHVMIKLCTLKTHLLKCYPLVAQNVTIFGNRIVEDVMSEDEVLLE